LAAAGDGHWPVRLHAVIGLGHVEDDPRAVRVLVAALADKREGVRRKAAQGLGRLKDRQAVPALIESLADGSGRVRERAAEALRSITGWRYGEDQKRWRRWWARETGG
jgi:HEAT repeat protein